MVCLIGMGLQQVQEFLQRPCLHALALVLDQDHQLIVCNADLEGNRQLSFLVLPILDGIFQQGLEQQLGNGKIHGPGVNIALEIQTAAEAVLLDLHIAFQILQVFTKLSLPPPAADAVAQERRQGHDHLHRRRGVQAHHELDVFQGVEQEMGIELGFQLLEFCNGREVVHRLGRQAALPGNAPEQQGYHQQHRQEQRPCADGITHEKVGHVGYHIDPVPATGKVHGLAGFVVDVFLQKHQPVFLVQELPPQLAEIRQLLTAAQKAGVVQLIHQKDIRLAVPCQLAEVFPGQDEEEEPSHPSLMLHRLAADQVLAGSCISLQELLPGKARQVLQPGRDAPALPHMEQAVRQISTAAQHQPALSIQQVKVNLPVPCILIETPIGLRPLRRDFAPAVKVPLLPKELRFLCRVPEKFLAHLRQHSRRQLPGSIADPHHGILPTGKHQRRPQHSHDQHRHQSIPGQRPMKA